MMKLITLLLILIPQVLMGQNFQNEHYQISIGSNFERAHSDLENGFLDIFKVFQDSTSKPKYLVYVMFNDIEEKPTSPMNDNFINEITSDLNCDIINKREFLFGKNKGVSLIVDYKKQNKEVVARVFAFIEKDKLIRLLVMLPNQYYFDKYDSEVTKIITSLNII